MIVIGLGVAVARRRHRLRHRHSRWVWTVGSSGGSQGAAPAAADDRRRRAQRHAGARACREGRSGGRAPGRLQARLCRNTDTPFTISTVMYDPADPANQATAKTVAAKLQITKIEPMSSDVKKAIKGEPVVVVVGEDRAGT